MKNHLIKRLYTIIALFFIFILPLYAQRDKIRFERLSIEQGLSQSSVDAIYQDHKGFLWFGTYDGINRYDGYGFKIFRHDANDSTSLSQNLVKDIYEDHFGTLWIGTEGGLNTYDREKEHFVRYMTDPKDSTSISNNRIRNIYEDRNNVVWIATEGGLNQYNRTKNSFKKYFHNPLNPQSLSNDLVRVIYEDQSGRLWLGTDGGLDLFDRANGQFTHFKNEPNNPKSLSENNITCIREDQAGFLWIGTRGGGINRFDQIKKEFTRYQFNPHDPSSLRYNSIRAICKDRTGDLWIGTYGGGLEKYNPKNNQFVHYQSYPNDPRSLSNNAIWCIFEDQSGILWIGTDYGGINKFDRRKNQFGFYANDPNNSKSLNNNDVNAFYEDLSEHGKFMWIGTWGGGLSRFNRETEEFISFRNEPNNPYSLSNDVVRCILKDHTGKLWIGTDGGLNRYDVKSGKFIRYRYNPNDPISLRHNMIKSIFEDHEGVLWIGTYGGGLEKYDRKGDQFIHYQYDPNNPESLSDNIVWCILEDRSGMLWIGTDAGGLNQFNRTNEQFIHYKNIPGNFNSVSDNKIICMYEDHSGILWLGTAGGGLNRYDLKNGKFTCYTEADGLPSNTIQDIVEDNYGNLWISTTQGLSKYNLQANAFITYHVQDGLQSDEFNVGSCSKSITGELFFGGINGFNVFKPEKITQNTFIPQIVLTDFQLFNKTVPIGKENAGHFLLLKSISESQELTLSYSDDVFSIEFAALEYAAPYKNMYAYILDGAEKNWNTVGNRRFATYTKLPAGNYTFHVLGSNHNGIWNTEGTSLRIIITPPFWEMWWFRMSCAIAIIGSLIFGYKIRTARIRAHNLELQQRVIERTNQLELTNKELEAFAYSVSHDLRAPLRAIDGYTHILTEDYRHLLDEEGKRICNVITNETQHMGRLINDLLSISRFSHAEMKVSLVQMESLTYAIFNELTTLESRNRIDFQVASLPPAIGDPTLIREVLMNLISNAIKFSSKREHPKIEVGSQQDGERIIYLVRDNGTGFDMQYANKLFGVFQRLHSDDEFEGTGIGLALVQRIIHRHGGEVWAESQLDKGTTLFFTIPSKGNLL